MNSIKDMVRDRKKVKFSFYRDKELWYVTENGFEFPVPIDEVGNATFLAEDKAPMPSAVWPARKRGATTSRRIEEDTASVRLPSSP